MDLPTLIKVIALALLQGITELFPISSLGHTVIIPGLLGWGNLIKSPTFLPLVVALHLGTAAALLTFFWRDWTVLIRAFFRTFKAGSLDADPKGHTVWLVIIGTLPAGLIGMFFEAPIKDLFFSAAVPVIPAAFLAVNGLVLLVGEWLRRRGEPAALDRVKQEHSFRTLDDLSFREAFLVGIAQAAALIPGISRSGITMVAGMGARLSHEESARFSFLLATPLIAGAGLLEIPRLFSDPHMLLYALIGAVIAGLAAYLSVKFLMRYFQVGRLTPFAYYCLGAGTLAFVLLQFRLVP
ncbi:MAG TPA: undecaprenyl-diphosphate phosphatase [Ktedonobacterales bacterium]|jgi:undecaprenyl-diphosphatase|nr:undecaprenyl-diphosphate phosphatase [Ktedonobacterales bacterium]